MFIAVPLENLAYYHGWRGEERREGEGERKEKILFVFLFLLLFPAFFFMSVRSEWTMILLMSLASL